MHLCKLYRFITIRSLWHSLQCCNSHVNNLSVLNTPLLQYPCLPLSFYFFLPLFFVKGFFYSLEYVFSKILNWGWVESANHNFSRFCNLPFVHTRKLHIKKGEFIHCYEYWPFQVKLWNVLLLTKRRIFCDVFLFPDVTLDLHPQTRDHEIVKKKAVWRHTKHFWKNDAKSCNPGISRMIPGTVSKCWKSANWQKNLMSVPVPNKNTNRTTVMHILCHFLQ